MPDEQPDPPQQSSETQQQRAQRAIEAIFAGGDLSAETLSLSNEFTDRQTSRLTRWLRRGQTGAMSYDTPSPESEIAPDAAEEAAETTAEKLGVDETAAPDTGSNATGSQSTSAVTADVVDSGMSDDIENSLTAQGVSDRETTREADRSETDARNEDDAAHE